MGVKVKQWKGAYWVFVNHKGQRRAKRVGDRKAAELVKVRIQAKLAEGDVSALETRLDTPVTLHAYGEAWLKTHAGQACKFSTRRIYESNLKRHIYPLLGYRTLASLTRADCRALVAACREKALSRKSIENIGRTLSSILS